MNSPAIHLQSSRTKMVAIIQARMGSTRLPGKVLAEIHGKPMLLRVVERTLKSEIIDEVIVATSTKTADDPIDELCRAEGVECFRGSEEDVLGRYYETARRCDAKSVVRITSDCPLIDSGVIDKVIRAFLAGQIDYASNSMVRTYPRGLDTEVFSFAALQRAHLEAHRTYHRAHVTPYLYENPSLFQTLSVVEKENYSWLRWTVDTPEDLAFVRAVYDRLGSDDCGFAAVLRLMKREPQLAELNQEIKQKALHEG